MNIDKLSKFLEENDASFSATRLAFLLWSAGVSGRIFVAK